MDNEKEKRIIIDDLSTKLVINDVEYLIGVPLDGAPILIDNNKVHLGY